MSQSSIDTLISQIANETQPSANSKTRVANVLRSLNTEKLDKESFKSSLAEVQAISPEFLEYLNTGQANITLNTYAYLGVATSSSTPPAEGAWWYRVDAPGTYMGVTVTAADFKDAQGNYYDVTLEVKDGVAEKKKTAKTVSTSTAKIQTWTAQAYTQGSQVFYNEKIYEANAATVAGDVPGISTKWVVVLSGGDAVKNFDAAIATKSGASSLLSYGFGTEATGESNYRSIRINQTPVTKNGTLTKISINNAEVVTALPFFVFRHESGNIFTNVKYFELQLIPGQVNVVDVSSLNIEMKTGDFLGVGCNGVNKLRYNENIGTSIGYDLGWDAWTEGNDGMFGAVSNFSYCYTYEVESVGLTGDEAVSLLKNLKKSGTSKVGATYLSAESLGVSSTKTADENTSALNNVITASRSGGGTIVLPGGVIRHRGFTFPEGTVLKGQGINKTTLLNESGGYALQDLDATNQNQFVNGALIEDLTIDGGGISAFGLNLRNHFYITVNRVVFRRFTDKCVQYEGVLTPLFNMVKFQESKNGVLLKNSTSSSVGYMAANMSRFNMCYFAVIETQCAEIIRGSNIVFDQCNFEGAGIAGNDNTGAIKASQMSPAGEGTDLIIMNGWSEGIRGSFLNISNSTGRTIIQNQMIFRGGNGSAGGGTAVVNNGCKVLISGTTAINGYTTGVITNGGSTYADGFAQIGSHTETSGGIFKTQVFS